MKAAIYVRATDHLSSSQDIEVLKKSAVNDGITDYRIFSDPTIGSISTDANASLKRLMDLLRIGESGITVVYVSRITTIAHDIYMIEHIILESARLGVAWDILGRGKTLNTDRSISTVIMLLLKTIRTFKSAN